LEHKENQGGSKEEAKIGFQNTANPNLSIARGSLHFGRVFYPTL
jgi:hypothetical protein